MHFASLALFSFLITMKRVFFYFVKKLRMPEEINPPIDGDGPEDTVDQPHDAVPPEGAGRTDTTVVRRREEIDRITRQTIQQIWPQKGGRETAVERVKKLQFVELTVSPDKPPEEALREIETVYLQNLVPDEVFLHLSQGAHYDVLRNLQQGMLHRFQPTPDELRLYPRDYESVRLQMYLDMLGGNDRPGDYRVFGLRDEQGVLRAWESFRLPSQNPEKMRLYIEYLNKTLFNHAYVHLEGETIERKLRKADYRLIEFDTANACLGYNMAGTLLLFRSLQRLHEEFGEADMPKGLFFYRFVGLTPVDPRPAGDDFDLDLGSNDATARASRRWGCTDIGYRHSEDELVIRANVPHADRPIRVSPKWRYSSAKTQVMLDMCEDYLREKGLLNDE